jgi:SAM-dependent methyltransferase
LYANQEKDLLRTTPCPEDLTPYYESEEYASHSEGGEGLMGWIYRRVRSYQFAVKLGWIRELAPDATSVLDIGTGTGEWLAFLKSRGYNVWGTEPSASGRSLASSKGLEVSGNLGDVGDKSFKVVTLWHVLEHVGELEPFFDQLDSCTTTGGLVLIAVPNFRSWDARHYGIHWAAWDVPRHVWHFSATGIQRILFERGYQCVKTYPLKLDAFYVSLLSERYKGNKFPYLSALINGFLSNQSAKRTSEYSSRVYAFKKSK